MIHTLTQHVESFVRHYLPSGKPFNAKMIVGSNLRKLVEAMSTEFYNSDITINEFMQEMMPDTTNEYIGHWERAVGIPDHCFEVALTIEERRLNVKRKLSLLGLQTATDFEEFALSMGLVVSVGSGADHDATNGYGVRLPDITFGSAQEARFTIVVKSFETINSFTYDFDFPFLSSEQALMECVFKHAKPANCNIVFVSE